MVRDANVASTSSQDHPAAKSNSFDPLPSRGNKSKARGRKQLDSLPESAPPLSSLEDAAGPNLKAILDELATGMPSILPAPYMFLATAVYWVHGRIQSAHISTFGRQNAFKAAKIAMKGLAEPGALMP
jgi:hypothetical protein